MNAQRLTPAERTAPACGACAVIPARLASTRFPEKMLAAATGKPLVQHVWERARLARRIDRVIVATDDRRIAEAVAAFGGEAVMTRSDHVSGTTRIAEVAAGLDIALVINVQGDEPEVDPALIDRLVELLEERPDCPMATLATELDAPEDFRNPNVVKLVRRLDGTALYFSRSPIPCDRDATGAALPLRHLGLYGYRREFLFKYASLAESPLERTERLEQLRALEHGVPIAVAVVSAQGQGIDTPEQYAAFVERYRSR